MKVIGGQSLRTPIDALQNAVSFNYYANSTYTKSGTYSTPAMVEAEQNVRNKGTNGLTTEELEETLEDAMDFLERCDCPDDLPRLREQLKAMGFLDGWGN